jgi:hypothetical protein
MVQSSRVPVFAAGAAHACQSTRFRISKRRRPSVATQVIFIVEVLSAAFVAWLGLYVITRDLPFRRNGPRQYFRVGLLAGNAMILLAVYFYGIAMETVATSPQEFLRLQQATWWGIPIGAIFFLWSAMLLTRTGENSTWVRVFYVLSFAYALFLAMGIASGFMLDATAIELRDSPFQPFYTPMQEPFIDFFHPFVLGALFTSFLLMLRQALRTERHTDEHRRALWLAMGSFLLLIGGVLSLILPMLNIWYLPKQIGDYTATAGAVVISYGIAKYNALEHEQLMEHDFWHSSTTVFVSVAIYLLSYSAFSLFFGYAISPMAIVALSALAVLTQTPYNWSGVVFDRVMLPRWAVAYRSRLVLMRQEPLTTANANRMLQEAQEEFDNLIRSVRREEIDELARDEVEHIFQYTRFDNPEVLAESRLHQLQSVQMQQTAYAEERNLPVDTLSEEQRAESLRLFLADAITEWIGPNGDGPSNSAASPEHIEQVILQKKYVEGWTRTEVEHYLHDHYELAVTGGAYSRHLKQARRSLADAIADREIALVAQPA